MNKYAPLRRFLEAQSPEFEVKLRFDEIADLVGGLPPSAAFRRQWWANTRATHSQAESWMDAGRLVTEVKMGERVVFSPVSVIEERDVAPQRNYIISRTRAENTILNGVTALEEVLKRAGYDSILQAVAAHTVFLDPGTVSQSRGKALFSVVRDPTRRGEVDRAKGVMYDNNATPTLTFLWAAQQAKGRDVQFNHVWADAKNRDLYTALWNLCVTPAFLAKTTDGSNHPEVIDALKFRSFELYGYKPNGVDPPKPPTGYESLTWQVSPPPVDDLEAVLRSRLRSNTKSGPAKSARELGWLFSDGIPDPSI